MKVGLLIGAFKANEFVTSVVFAFSAKLGTVGAAAVPPKSPANCNLPLVTASASEIVADAICASTYVFTALWVGNSVVLAPKAALDLLDASSFKASELVTSVALAFKAKPGTVGKSAVPAKSPASLSFPLAAVLASVTPAEAVCWTKAVVAMLVLLSPAD